MPKSSMTCHQMSWDVRFRGSDRQAWYICANSRRLGEAYVIGDREGSVVPSEDATAERIPVDFVTEVGSLRRKVRCLLEFMEKINTQ